MGLDVYLYRYTDHDARYAAEHAREKQHEKIWHADGRNYDQLTEAQREAFRAQCDEHDAANPLPGSEEKIEIDSSKYPAHMFKIGYLRSSYNEGGINSVLRDQLGADLYSVFKHERDEYHVKVDWAAAKDRAADLLAKFNAYVETNGFCRVTCLDHNPYISLGDLPDSGKAALDVFAKERADKKAQPGGFDSYSGRNGTFYLGESGFTVRAFIPGRSQSQRGPCIYAVYEGYAEWYRQALEITVEMCEWVLAQPKDPAVEYVLHWSG